jgi:molecular chaperone DnaK
MTPQFDVGETVGIDLGTSFSAIARLGSNGVPNVFKNSTGKRWTASTLLLGDGQHAFVGPSAASVALADPQNVVVGIKREMGSTEFAIDHNGRRLNPEVLSALILMKLKRDAEQETGRIANAVITVPYYFNELRRRATQTAGDIAGLNVIDIINEPTAATLAYAWLQGDLGKLGPSDQPKTILVYDLGGGTFDVTLVKYTPTEFSVIATDGDTRLGGLDWTDRLAEHVSGRLQRQYGVDLRTDQRASLELTLLCEDAKRELSTNTETAIHLQRGDHTLTCEFSREDFENVTADLLQRTRDTIEFVLDYASASPSDLDDVILVGGSTRMPAVSQMLMQLTQRAPCIVLDPQLAVAQGAAVHAAILQAKVTGSRGDLGQAVLSRLRNITATDVNSHSLGVEITDVKRDGAKRNHIMIPRNTELPSTVTGRFVTTTDSPNAIRIRLLEGEAEDPRACTFIGHCRIVNLPDDLPTGTPVEVTYGYDNRGHVHVSARELAGNTAASVEIAWDGGMDEPALAAFRKLVHDYRVQ